jgi:hypothetical protein
MLNGRSGRPCFSDIRPYCPGQESVELPCREQDLHERISGGGDGRGPER